MSSPTEKNHYYWLDMMRFIAAFIVVLSHCRGFFFVPYAMLPPDNQTVPVFGFYFLTRLGQEAVLAFFVMSGFLVGGKAIERMRAGNFQLKGYLYDRGVRIMLPLISALVFIAGINMVIGKEVSLVDMLGNLFSLQGILVHPVSGPLWSLSYEVWFYISVVGISLLFGNTVKSRAWGMTILVACAFVFTKLEAVYLLIWYLGAFSYFIIPRKTNLLKIGSILVGVGITLVLTQMTTESSTAGPRLPFPLPPAQTLETVLSVLLILLMINLVRLVPASGFLKKVDAFGGKLAAFSYTLYLTHFSLFFFLEYLGFPKSNAITVKAFSFYCLEVVLAIFVAWLIYYFFEKRTPAVKKRLRKILEGETAPVVTVKVSNDNLQ